MNLGNSVHELSAVDQVGRPLRILLAEDDYEVRVGLAQILQLDGYEVHAVASGSELLDYMASWILREEGAPEIDVLITDIRMPGFNGLNIAEGLRATGWRHPVIIISAFGDPAVRERVLRLGTAAFIDKPLDPDTLEHALEVLLMR